MIDPIRHRQLEELNIVETCVGILHNARNELYLNMRYLDVSLSSLGFEADGNGRGLGTDGFLIYYDPEYLIGLFRRGRVYVNRAYLHIVYHCLFCHPDVRGNRNEEYWNLACDIAVESMLDELYIRCIHVPVPPFRLELYQRLRKDLRVLNAEGIYRVLQNRRLTEAQFGRLAAEFLVDDHQYWQAADKPPESIAMRPAKWNDNREKMQTELETMGSREEQDTRNLLEMVQVENRERYDYKRFLRKFAVQKEEMQVNEDAFDYAFYKYGLDLYGNMPLIEPPETREVNRIEDFVIVIDTSMSCSGELVRRFLEETYDILCETESYFKKVNIRIIQCDEQVQADQQITGREEMETYMEHFRLIGQGGTDFRPAFEHVNRLLKAGAFQKLKGLLYFTDGEGIYPVRRPVYDTVFVFIEDQYTDISVPPWAMKLIIEPEDAQHEY